MSFSPAPAALLLFLLYIDRRVPSIRAWSCSRSLLIWLFFFPFFLVWGSGPGFLENYTDFKSTLSLRKPREGGSWSVPGDGIATSCLVGLLCVTHPCKHVNRALSSHRSLLPPSLGNSCLIVFHVIIRPGGNAPSSHSPAKTKQRHKGEGMCEQRQREV